jgi:VWFA-related protein
LLETIAGVTGGRAFFPNAYHEQQIVEICARIAIELRSQYSIGFYPSSRGDGTWHRIQVKLKMPKGLGRVSIRHREGYQAVKR